jgi:DNA polymerase-3 subunit gamma/tau
VSYQVLARKWRPRNFSELVGQEHVVRPLINALDHNRLHHAFLFTGTRGVGKTTIARVLAKSLNCETGVTSKPCGKCSACLEVDEGRFVDLIEVDAASRTKVDDTRELLDNVQYAPTRGRYKVYLIDEVHMLSGHSFNALLKTLEEPPPHVKFLLATTDPQKLPVTVLSRCLQFNLKRLSAEQIGEQLKKILDAEKIAHDDASLALLARAADGSMRDGLSLLDQAIAFGGGKLGETEVRAMLGTIDRDTVDRCLNALAGADAKELLAAIADAVEHGTDLEALLEEILRALHEIAIAQADANLVADERIRNHARAFKPEDVQLYYQIGVLGRRDLPYAPDPRSGVEMTLLRMLAFRPVEAASVAPAKPSAVTTTPAKPVAKISTVAQAPAPVSAALTPGAPAAPKMAAVITNWNDTAAQLKLSGFARELASNSTLESNGNGVISLILEEACAGLLNKDRETQLRQALEDHLGSPVRLSVRVGKASSETLAKERNRMQDEKQQAAVQAIQDDPNVRAMQERFGARVNPNSIRPKV